MDSVQPALPWHRGTPCPAHAGSRGLCSRTPTLPPLRTGVLGRRQPGSEPGGQRAAEPCRACVNALRPGSGGTALRPGNRRPALPGSLTHRRRGRRRRSAAMPRRAAPRCLRPPPSSKRRHLPAAPSLSAPGPKGPPPAPCPASLLATAAANHTHPPRRARPALSLPRCSTTIGQKSHQSSPVDLWAQGTRCPAPLAGSLAGAPPRPAGGAAGGAGAAGPLPAGAARGS